MTTVSGWTGREATLLRRALRLSVRDFAAHLGVGARTINKWEARQADVTPLPYMQSVLDTALARAPDEAKARFAATTQTAIAGRMCPVGGVLVPVVAEGQVVFVRINPDDTGRGPGQLAGVTVGAPDAAVWKVASWVDRRDFGQHVAGLVLGAAGLTGLDLDRLLTLLPDADPTGTRHLGIADVEIIEQATAVFRAQDYSHGGGPLRQAAIAQLRSVLPLLNAQVTDELRPRLMIAIARLAMQTGWISFDVKHHDTARRLWMTALDISRNTEHSLGSDLTVFLLYDMACQALHLHRPDEALHLTKIGRAVIDSRPVSGSTSYALANTQARAHAMRGDKAACDQALGQVITYFSIIDPATAPPWVAHISEAGVSGYQGAAYYTLARTTHAPRIAGRAVTLLQRAVDQHGPEYARTRALWLPDLAGANAIAGDTDTAVTLGHQAIDAITGLSSPRAYDRLRTLNTVLEPLHASPGVADLRDRLASTAA